MFKKRFKGGEDGLSVSSDQRMIMVADGVGGWTNRGVDPGKYAKFLCKQAALLFMEKPQKTLQEILTEADRVNPNKQGSSTAVMASLAPGAQTL